MSFIHYTTQIHCKYLLSFETLREGGKVELSCISQCLLLDKYLSVEAALLVLWSWLIWGGEGVRDQEDKAPMFPK